MNRKIAIVLAACLLAGTLAVPARARPERSRRGQSGGPIPGAIVHVVQWGETLFSIAQQYGLTVDAVTHANGISDPRRIYAGQRLVIPGGRTDVSVEETASYVVQAGDALASIARRYNTTWQTLAQVNGLLSPNVVHAGQIIQVPVSDVPTNEGMFYVVRPDDTLLRIALRCDISPWMLTAVSQIANPALIYPGQELVVPGEGPGLLPEPFAVVEVQPLPVTQGTTMVVVVHTTEPVTLQGRLFGQEVRFAEERGVYYGLVGVHVFAEPGLYELELAAVDGGERSTVITTGVVVEAGRFGYERIDVSTGRTSLLDPDTVARDRERFDAVRHIFTPERFWTAPFQRPCVGPISAYFGSHRSYNGGPYTSYHSGVDFRAPSGTPVYASAAGTVVLAEPMALWGNAIVIDHGWSVLTGYGHLSTIEVQVGQQVAPGDLIGKVGNTGLSTGAHLHWETWVTGNSVNGLQWLEEFYPWPEQLAIGG
ncbi:MAG: LysM peptidoglycan-binding domain-containing protein [Chloroflexota bacterium]|nr:LysM peptidoglycan-binding domain-containing protein [Chloroflexota bacterium]